MAKLTCEMCGSTNLVKQDGMFVCQDCETKYSVEEAKKMMGAINVDVSGSTVKVDTSDELSNLYMIARRAKDDNNAENAAKYYDMILVKDPTSWEASFYVVYYKAMQCKIAEIYSAAVSVCNCINTVLNLIKDNVESKAEQIKAVEEVFLRCDSICNMLGSGAVSHYKNIGDSIRSDYRGEMTSNVLAAINILYTFGNGVDLIYGDYREFHSTAVKAWKTGIELHAALTEHMNKNEKESSKELIMNYADKIQKYDSEYTAPTIDTSGACYVATAVYGSYDCPQVWTLRRYRDYTLAETWYGRAFIRTYYAISPTLVKWFGETQWFKNLFRGKLDKMVKNLNEKGVENTPYED